MYDLGNAANGAAPWDATLRPAIGTYHLNPDAVEAQLQQLYDSGQRKIALVLWYMPFTTAPYPGSEPDMWIHVVNSRGGRLSTQHEQNLRSMLRWIAYIGFDEVTLRFAQQGGADPSSDNAPWSSGWSEQQYLENLAFITNTRSIMESELAPTSIRRQYDLGVELGGITKNQAGIYTKRLWTDYVARFGNADSYGFSFAIARGRVAQQIAIYDQTGTRPNEYAIDVYGAPSSDPIDVAIDYVHEEMARAGEGEKPVIIQETFANDEDTARRILLALTLTPMKIRYIMQWPVYSAQQNVHVLVPSQYNAYGGSAAPGGILSARSCVLPADSHLCTSKISWSTSNTTNTSVFANGALMAMDAHGTASANWISGPNQFQLTSDQGVLDNIVITAFPAGTPTLDWLGAGLSCDKFQCVTATGSNIENGCTVGIFAPDWSTYLGAGLDVSCKSNSVTFRLPESIQRTYEGINFNVNNPSGRWSEPVYVPIDPPPPVLYKAGLACDQNQCIWASAINVTAGCSVSLFAPDWSSTLAVLTNVSCQHDRIAFEIPAWIRQQYQAIHFNVNNSYQKWSAPMYVRIR
jgi:hypothetical protein